MNTLGNKFLQERERRGLSLDDVSNVTKISSRLLKAIEDEHFNELPGGVFNKGFIRAYAKHLGLDGEEAVNEYLIWLRQAQIEANTVPAPPSLSQQRSTQQRPQQRIPAPPAVDLAPPKTQITSAEISRPQVSKPLAPRPQAEEELPELQLPKAEHIRPGRRPINAQSGIAWRVPALVVGLIAVVILLWSWHSRSARAGEPVVPPVVATSKTSLPVASATAAPNHAANTPAPNSAMTAANKNSRPAKATSAPALQTLPSPHPASVADNGRPTNAAATTPIGSPAAQPAPRNTQLASSQSATSAASTQTSQQETAPVVRFTLVIRATENSWVSVAADGQTVAQETLIAPAHTSVRATHEVVVRTGNAAGVSFLLNGREIPSQGAEAEAKTFVFDNSGLRAQQ